jgi:hypothetical protein
MLLVLPSTRTPGTEGTTFALAAGFNTILRLALSSSDIRADVIEMNAVESNGSGKELNEYCRYITAGVLEDPRLSWTNIRFHAVFQ